jgi:predicted RNA binding protein YcfA (HicA-like mRNA interferase family)
MKLPRDISAGDLIKSLNKIGYEVTRQKGSHIRLTYTKENVSHHITIPNHNPIKIGTLNSILKDLSAYLKISKDEVLSKYF